MSQLSVSESTKAPTSQAMRNSRPRHAWRQTLVDAEAGWKHGIRGSSSLFVYFFSFSIVLCAGVVVQLLAWQWTVIALCMTAILGMELLSQTLLFCFEQILESADSPNEPSADRSKLQSLHQRLTALNLTVQIGCGIAMLLAFSQRFSELAEYF